MNSVKNAIVCFYPNKCKPHTTTADFIKNVLSVYSHSMTTIYLSLSAQVAKSTYFMKYPVLEGLKQVFEFTMNNSRFVSIIISSIQ